MQIPLVLSRCLNEWHQGQIIFFIRGNNSANNLSRRLAQCARRENSAAYSFQRLTLPSTPKCSITNWRINTEFSPIPPVKIMPSNRCNDAACPAQYDGRCAGQMFYQQPGARSCPHSRFFQTLCRMTTSEMPSKPDSLFTTRSRSLNVCPVSLTIHAIAPNQRRRCGKYPSSAPRWASSPLRYPRSGPLRTAQTDAPLPRCATQSGPSFFIEVKQFIRAPRNSDATYRKP